MYKISEFSKITSLTVKALRYYDEEGMLKPSIRLDNHYRVYSQEDYERAKVIQLLRSLDFSIQEIKDVLASYQKEEDLSYYLEEKKELLRKQIEIKKSRIKQLDQLIASKKINEETNNLNYAFQIKEIQAQKIISIRYKGSYQEVSKYIPILYKEAKKNASGAPFHLYYDEEYKEVADCEVCLPIKNRITSSKVAYKELPKIKALCTTHIGSYETLSSAYKAILDEAKDKGFELLLPSREVYVKGPGMILKGNPQKYVTYIMIPIK